MKNYVLTMIVYCTGCEVESYGDVCTPCRGCLTYDVSSGFCSTILKLIQYTICTHYNTLTDNHNFSILEGYSFTCMTYSYIKYGFAWISERYKRIS